MASHLHQSSQRPRTSPPRTKKTNTAPAATGAPTSAAVGSESGLSVIVVGSGTMNLAGYVLALQQLELAGSLRVRALVGFGDESARGLRSAFPHAFTAPTLDAVVAAPGALVLLASSPHMHPAHAGAALRRGWHVLSVAPLARSMRDATAMTAVAKRNERMLSAALPWRFSPALEYLRALCRDQLVGPLLGLSIHDGAPPSPTAIDNGDGVLLEFGLYAFDLICWCVGVPKVTRYADDAMGGIETNARLDIDLPDGVHGTIHLSSDWPTTRTYEFVFERGIAQWRPDEANRLTLQLASAPSVLNADVVPLHGAAQRYPGITQAPSSIGHIVAELENVAAAISNNQRPRVSAAETVQALMMVEYCHAHRTLLDCPWFTRNEVAHARSLSTPGDSTRS